MLKPNYRGSVGYGELFMRPGFKQWGRSMQDDLIDGVDWLVKEGISDPDRVCVVGASYGGYAALVSAYRSSDRFRCAASLAGVANLDTMDRRSYDFDLVKRNRDRMQSGDQLRANSPYHHADDFVLPLLMVHGDEDTVVSVDQSRALAPELQAAKKPFSYIEQSGGDHFLSGGGQRREFFSHLGRFLDEHLHPETEPQSAAGSGD
ncbi:MAG: S9 family peptidase [Gammaproteobacteria bacterium]|nr:S9 family peptidase [Gammaproteobacteria bacterium]